MSCFLFFLANLLVVHLPFVLRDHLFLRPSDAAKNSKYRHWCYDHVQSGPFEAT